MLGSARMTWFVGKATSYRSSGSKPKIVNDAYEPRKLALREPVTGPISASNYLKIDGYFTSQFSLSSNQ
ncbi:hypothetical protein F7O85_10420 [Vibrio panuliri]|nr:hypothetical protein F7O85_10420 [Vibrio panuliri]